MAITNLEENDLSENEQVAQAFWKSYAEAFAHPLKSGGLLNKFTTNSNVTGAYAEAWVRFMVKSMIPPQFRISTGTVIRSMDQKRGLQSIPQCDIIIWEPSELPALFEQGDFALVPFHSARAIIEVKRTKRSIPDFKKQLEKQQKLLLHEYRSNILGVVINHQKSLFDGEVEPDWLTNQERRNKPAMVRLLSDSQEPDVDEVFAFIYFLSQVAKLSSSSKS